jgi:hypothetical protein
MFNIEIHLFLGRIVEGLPNEIPIVGMHALKNQIECRLSRSIAFKDIAGFVRPVDLSVGSTPTETSGLTYLLPLGQESLAAVQLLMRLPALINIRY